jgi:hypothetical protein
MRQWMNLPMERTRRGARLEREFTSGCSSSGVHAEVQCLGGVGPFVGEETGMRDLLRGGIAGIAAWKLGGGCISTIIIFLIIFWLLGYVF